jgi:hypothetical protein
MFVVQMYINEGMILRFAQKLQKKCNIKDFANSLWKKKHSGCLIGPSSKRR